MADDTLERLRARLPELFAAAVSRLEQRAAGGDAALAQRLAAAGATSVPSLLRLTGEGGDELWFDAGRAGLELRAAPAAASEFGHALELPLSAARYALLIAERDPGELEEVVGALAAIASATAREALTKVSFCFAIEVPNVPVIGTLRARVGFGRPVLAARPEFSLRVDADELEDAREQGLGPHQLFLAGKIKIEGDAAKAMQLAMVLAQLR